MPEVVSVSDVLDRFVVRRMVVLTNTDAVNVTKVVVSYQRHTTQLCLQANSVRPLFLLTNK